MFMYEINAILTIVHPASTGCLLKLKFYSNMFTWKCKMKLKIQLSSIYLRDILDLKIVYKSKMLNFSDINFLLINLY